MQGVQKCTAGFLVLLVACQCRVAMRCARHFYCLEHLYLCCGLAEISMCAVVMADAFSMYKFPQLFLLRTRGNETWPLVASFYWFIYFQEGTSFSCPDFFFLPACHSRVTGSFCSKRNSSSDITTCQFTMFCATEPSRAHIKLLR